LITPTGIFKIIMATNQLHTVALMKAKKTKRKKIRFRGNNLSFHITWIQFKRLLDSYDLVRENRLFQSGDDAFQVQGGNCVIRGSSCMLPAIIPNEKYPFDCKGKVIHDVGGFQGETAVIYSAKGAKKIIIYEPVVAHHRFIEENMALNNVNAEIHYEGVGDHDGVRIIHYQESDMSLGCLSCGTKEMTIKIRNVSKVIEQSHADIAKFNCEGAEESLVSVPNETLRKIPLYIIDAHSQEIRDRIVGKFADANFKLIKAVSEETRLFFALVDCSPTFLIPKIETVCRQNQWSDSPLSPFGVNKTG